MISVVLSVPERPLPVKADVQILTLEISLQSDRYTPVSGHQADTMSRGRYRPKADIGDPLPIRHAATILRSLATPIKPNPPKDGDGKPRNDSPKDPKFAGLPKPKSTSN